jgi:hypothetical protein
MVTNMNQVQNQGWEFLSDPSWWFQSVGLIAVGLVFCAVARWFYLRSMSPQQIIQTAEGLAHAGEIEKAISLLEDLRTKLEMKSGSFGSRLDSLEVIAMLGELKRMQVERNRNEGR